MSEMNEKVEEPQEQPSDRPALREVSPEDLVKILAAHRKWVESEGKEGEGANLSVANLQGADLRGANLQNALLIRANLQKAILYGANLQEANLQEAKLSGAEGLTASQVEKAKNWNLAFYSDDFLKKLRLPPNHNEWVKKKLAELDKEKKAKDPKR